MQRCTMIALTVLVSIPIHQKHLQQALASGITKLRDRPQRHLLPEKVVQAKLPTLASASNGNNVVLICPGVLPNLELQTGRQTI